jgi:O-antigen/teichoic acid export membrane protein
MVERRTNAIIWTALGSYLGRFGSGIAVLVNIPLAKNALDPELFGIWMMLSAMMLFLQFADLGIGNALQNCLTEVAEDPERKNQLAISAYKATTLVSVLILTVWIGWIELSDNPTGILGKLRPEHLTEAAKSLNAFVTLFALNIPASLIHKINLSKQKGHWGGVGQFAAALASLILVPLSLKYQIGVPGLIYATLGAQVAVNIAISCAQLRIRRGRIDNKQILNISQPFEKRLYVISAQFLALQIATALAYQSDAIVISQTLGQETYGSFATTQRLFLIVSMILAAAQSGLWPAFGDALARKDKRWAKKAFLRSLLLSGAIASVTVIALIIEYETIFSLWIKTTPTMDYKLLIALGVWTVLDSMSSVSGAMMNGANVIAPQIAISLLLGVCAVVLKLTLTPILGEVGAVLGTIIAYIIISLPAQYYIYRRIFNTERNT